MNYAMWQIALGLFMAWATGYAIGVMVRVVFAMFSAVVNQESE